MLMDKTGKIAEFIESMPRDEFVIKFVRKIGQTASFGALATFHAQNISAEEKEQVRTTLTKIGVPSDLMETDDDLDNIAAFVSARAVTLR